MFIYSFVSFFLLLAISIFFTTYFVISIFFRITCVRTEIFFFFFYILWFFLIALTLHIPAISQSGYLLSLKNAFCIGFAQLLCWILTSHLPRSIMLSLLFIMHRTYHSHTFNNHHCCGSLKLLRIKKSIKTYQLELYPQNRGITDLWDKLLLNQ